MAEEWRAVPGWPHYHVSSLGRVRGTKGILKPWRLKNGRWQVRLCSGGEQKHYHTYKLVALAFLGPPPFPGAIVAHKDDDKDNNALSNLKWCTMRENYEDRDRNGKTARGLRNGAHTHPHKRPRGERQGNAKLTEAAVAMIRNSCESQRTLASRLGVSKTTIAQVMRGDTWRHCQ